VKLKLAVVTLFPEMFRAVVDYGVTGRAFEQGLAEFAAFNPREFCQDKHRTVDDRPYGGGPGMVMLAAPLKAAIEAARQWAGEDVRVIYLSPQGRPLVQPAVTRFAAEEKALVLVAGRYEGVDERVLAWIDEECSIGDYVVSGGELPAMVLIDAILRQLPGVLGHAESAQDDSFAQGLLGCPQYTRPETFAGAKVPAVLLSGDHEAIRRWRLKHSLARTLARRPELLDEGGLDPEKNALLEEIRREAKPA